MSGFPVRWRLSAFALAVALVLPFLAPPALRAAAAPGPAAVTASMGAGEPWVGRVVSWLRLTLAWDKPAAPAQDKRLARPAPVRRLPVRRDEGCGIDPNGHQKCC
jgi:hypothetical protein